MMSKATSGYLLVFFYLTVFKKLTVMEKNRCEMAIGDNEVC